MTTLQQVSSVYYAIAPGNGMAAKKKAYVELLKGAIEEDDVDAVAALTYLIWYAPLHVCKMSRIVDQMVALHRNSVAATPGSLADQTLSLDKYLVVLREKNPGENTIFRPDMPFSEALRSLCEGRRSSRHLKQVLSELGGLPVDVAAFLEQFYTRAWKLAGVAEGTIKKVLTDASATGAPFEKVIAMTKSVDVVSTCLLTGTVPRLTGKHAVTPVLLNQKIYNDAESAMDGLAGKRSADGAKIGAVATLKLDGFSVNLSFSKNDDGTVQHQIAFRTRGNLWTIGAGMSSIAMAIADELSKDATFSEMIVGGEVVVMDEHEIMLPSVQMHEWNRPGNRLGFVVYHMLLLNGMESTSIKEDLQRLDSVFTADFVRSVSESALFGTAYLAPVTFFAKYRKPLSPEVGLLPMRLDVRTTKDLDEYFRQVIDAGLEGVVLTNRSRPLEIGVRNDQVLKMKPKRTDVTVQVVAFNKRIDGTVKELIVAVKSDTADVLFAYATVGNLTNVARSALARLFSKRMYNAKQGCSNVPLPTWLRVAAAAPGTYYLHPESPSVLPVVEIRGYPSSLVQRRYGRDMPRGVPASLTFAKLVPETVSALIGGTSDGPVNWQTAPFDCQLNEISQSREPDTLLFNGKVVRLVKPTQPEQTDALALAEELVRHCATVTLDAREDLAVDYTVDSQDAGQWNWVFQCAVANQLLPFPSGAPVRQPVHDVCPHCGK